MSSYEFWDELGKIFSAVVAYQEKNIEFNKRFISPWIRLGNVFDKQDRDNEAISSYEKAIEIDPGNAQYWFELGNIHFKTQRYDKAVEAFNKAIELDPGSGWSYNNLALTLVSQGKYEQAIPLYQKGIELLVEDKDKAVAWNRLGNAYRKLDEYDVALEAFRKADELDRDNAGFRDTLDEVSQGPTLVQSGAEGSMEPGATLTISPMELIVAESHAEEAASRSPHSAADFEATADAGQPASPEASTQAAEINQEPVSEASYASGTESQVNESSAVREIHDAPLEVADTSQSGNPAPPAHEAVTPPVHGTTEAFAEPPTSTDASFETSDSAFTAGAARKAFEDYGPLLDEVLVPGIDQSTDSDPAFAVLLVAGESSDEAVDPEATEVAQQEAQQAAADVPVEGPVLSLREPIRDQDASPMGTSEQNAYEEFLKDSIEPLRIYEQEDAKAPRGEKEAAAAQEPAATIDPSGELQIEMDTKNANVWNELGNAYFNTGAFDDAIVAYSKAIEIDRWFAWPYSNLALAYVQRRRFVEAILLYQRSIELFTTEKDKAISWNRLGNVYRRLNDYENAIQAYQQADELDPDNTTLSLQSRFSLLGSYALEQKPSYVS